MQGSTHDWAWAAGFIDGEGSVRIRHIHNKRKNTHSYGVSLSASQIVREPLEKLELMFGGATCLKAPVEYQRATHAPYYTWMNTGTSAVAAIQVILPWLTVKREQAKLALEFQEIVVQRKGARHTYRLKESDLAIRRHYFDKMRELNLRWTQRRAAAETKSERPLAPEAVCDSPVCMDDKHAEQGRNIPALRRVV
jgi:hypothetical protein